MKRLSLLLVMCAACASQPSPVRPGPESARPRCSSFAAPDVSAATVERLAHASNVIDYENAWKADHPGATTGTISGAEVRSIVHSKMAEVQRCYAAAISGGDGGGRVVVRFLIDEAGHVVTAHVGANSFGAPEVGCCLVNRVASWQFPKPTSGFVSVEYPFVVRISHQ
jgi:outer membrane biosynthesis protein TonB